jgi:hypothetical protein
MPTGKTAGPLIQTGIVYTLGALIVAQIGVVIWICVLFVRPQCFDPCCKSERAKTVPVAAATPKEKTKTTAESVAAAKARKKAQ